MWTIASMNAAVWPFRSATVVENDDPCSDEFRPAGDLPAALDFFDNDGEVKPIVERRGNPMVLLRHIAEVNGAMVIGHGAIACWTGTLANERECLPRSKLLIGVAATVHPVRFAAQLGNPAPVR